MSSSVGSSRYVDVNGAESEAHVPVSTTDELDPSLAGGFRVIYDRETPFELRIQDADNTPQQIGTLEAIKVKILILGSDTDIHVVRVELSTESDLFFLYTHTCDLESFQAMQEQQKLMVDFTDYANVLIRMLNNCIKEPHNHLAVYLMQVDGRARLDFIQNMEYKFIELLSVDFVRASEVTIRQHITFRYTSMKSRLQVLQTRLHEVNNIVKTKNPSLLLQLQKAVPSPSSRNRYLTH
ncbi:Centriolar protein SAS N-terminal [Phytophthora infestans]|uniref:Centriolar protein SAS N-terminal n=1 Tax=Phytophthora infestans TaxID=4787 RepID=A0A833T9S5_PHYIN|nr:Centriolar protein SAS N-terminal [Phytophthora infestans]KAF4128733.1 Centriolar protein SAS N-terminal [Phytophthora infestans]KAI9986754.1 hypothetical protein PInf_025711 [Phytophthora infestans]